MNPHPNDCHCGCCQKIIYPQGNKGSDFVTSCGIDENNILYYIGSNYHNCLKSYKTEPSLVRINLTNFNFIDRTIINEIENFNNSNWDKDSDYNKAI